MLREGDKRPRGQRRGRSRFGITQARGLNTVNILFSSACRLGLACRMRVSMFLSSDVDPSIGGPSIGGPFELVRPTAGEDI